MQEELKANVLVVDDEEQFIKVFSERLKVRGLKVDTATSGEDSIKRVNGKEFDTIFMDLVMPGMDGIETLKKIRKESPEHQIIILTGHGTIDKSVEAMKEGAAGFLEKPADIEKILDTIAEAKRKTALLVEKKHEKLLKEILNSKGW